MYVVTRLNEVVLSRQTFKAGTILPENRDYSALIDLGIVEKVANKTVSPPIIEPSITTITMKKVKKMKKKQKKEKEQRQKAEKAAEIVEPEVVEDITYTVETGG